MARAPRLPGDLEFRVLHMVCGLSPRLQRLVFGRPPEIDGQVLATDIHALLRLASIVGSGSLAGGLPPAEARVYIRKDADATAGPPLPMAEVRELEYPGAAGPLPARLYIPRGAIPKPRPLLLFFHGGGYVIGGLDTHDNPCRFLAAHSGAMVLSCTYRLAPEHQFPAAVEDARAAFAWTLEQAAGLGADPGQIAIGGDSAGANLATGVCIAAREGGGPAPAMQLLIYPVTDASGRQRSRRLFAQGFKLEAGDIDEFEHCYLPDMSFRTDPYASVILTADLSGLPPAYVATAGFDPLRDEGEEYAKRMQEAGVAVALRRHPRLIHTFANLTAFSPSARAAMLEIAGALRMGLAESA